MVNIETHILVVDDNPATCYSTSRVLRSAGWKVSEAMTGQEAIELWQQGPDLIVLDVNLPDMDGFEVCRRIRAQETVTRTPVVHLSATFVQDADKIQGLESGADGYLTHPIEPPVLIATVNAFLRARRAEHAMRESEIRYKAVFDNAYNGIAVLDKNHCFVEVNPAMSHLLRRDGNQILGRSLLDFVAEENRPHVVAILEQLEMARTWRGNFPLISAEEDAVQLEWHMSTHSPGLWLAIVSDISDQVRYQEERESLLLSERSARSEAEHANQLKDEFLATLSHELRNPLNNIVGWSRLLNMEGIDDESIREGLNTIESNGQALSDMITDLLDVARISSGKLRLEVAPMYPIETLEAAIRAIQPAAESKGLRVVTTLDPKAGPILGDASRLQQVFWNLLTNAIKFTPKQGRVSILLRKVASSIEINITDSGMGMTPSTLNLVFERFRQADATSTREHGGLGLGLAITKQLVELHGGSIKADSPGLGQGSTFTVESPDHGSSSRIGNDIGGSTCQAWAEDLSDRGSGSHFGGRRRFASHTQAIDFCRRR